MTTEQLVNTAANGGRIKESRRGLNVYNRMQLVGTSAVDKKGQIQNVTYELPYFGLSIDERIDIFRLCSAVFGIVTSRMNRIASLEWTVTSDYKMEDKLADEFKYKKAIYDDFIGSSELKYKIAAKLIAKELLNELPELLPDMSNFNRAIMRWSKNLKKKKMDISDEIWTWLQQPNEGLNFINLVKQTVFDLMVHGAFAYYKEILNGRVENIYLLPGGTVIPVRNKFVGGINAYLQIVDADIPQIMFNDEVVYDNYVPTSARTYGMIPIEALINKIAESLLFDQLMAEQADGTKPPQKIIVFGDISPFGDIGSDFNTAMNPEKQKRIENVLNTARKNAIKVLSGVGQPLAVDLTRENTMSVQNERQKLIREETALVFNMSNMEINMSSSDGVSGRATSESLETIDQNKGVLPIVRIFENSINIGVLPFRFGSGFRVESQISSDPDKELDRYLKMANSGIWSINEIRTEEIGKDPFQDSKYDEPKGGQQQSPQMGGGMGDLLGGDGDV